MHRAILLLSLLAPAVVLAQAEELENPGTVSAVQERAYRLQHELSLSLGVLPLDAFSKGIFAQVGYTFHFSDVFAWQVGRGSYNYNAKTGLREQLERDFNVLPTNPAFNEIQFFIGSDLMWKPFYGKLSVVNKWVVHGEAYLLLGATVFRFTDAFRPGVSLGAGARVFITKFASARLDVCENVVLPSGAGAKTFSNVMTITLGLGINFGGTE